MGYEGHLTKLFQCFLKSSSSRALYTESFPVLAMIDIILAVNATRCLTGIWLLATLTVGVGILTVTLTPDPAFACLVKFKNLTMLARKTVNRGAQ
eukprot:1175743-Prorocentrum_minimum.AAC.5